MQGSSCLYLFMILILFNGTYTSSEEIKQVSTFHGVEHWQWELLQIGSPFLKLLYREIYGSAEILIIWWI